MKVIINFDINNACFDGLSPEEAMTEVLTSVINEPSKRAIHDVNGNTIGEIQFKGE
jgi:hypothetical protein